MNDGGGDDEIRALRRREILSKKLSKLLGFEDGASGVLDYLFTIETGESLLEYMSQLLGREDEQVRQFVEDIGRVQRGESVEWGSDEEGDEAKPGTKPPTAVEGDYDSHQTKEAAPKRDAAPPLNDRRPSAAAAQQQQQQQQQKRKQNVNKQTQSAATARKPKAGPPSNQPTTVDERTTQQPISKQAQSNVATSNTKTIPSETHPKAAVSAAAAKAPVPVAGTELPPRGEARTECGCYGTYHPALSNCLQCGRVSCEKEGYDYCPFCGYLVSPPVPPSQEEQDENSPLYKAWALKESMLKKDRDESGKVMRVIDDQADYFTTTGSVWLTQKEQADASEKEQRRQIELHQRQKMQLKLAPI